MRWQVLAVSAALTTTSRGRYAVLGLRVLAFHMELGVLGCWTVLTLGLHMAASRRSAGGRQQGHNCVAVSSARKAYQRVHCTGL